MRLNIEKTSLFYLCKNVSLICIRVSRPTIKRSRSLSQPSWMPYLFIFIILFKFPPILIAGLLLHGEKATIKDNLYFLCSNSVHRLLVMFNCFKDSGVLRSVENLGYRTRTSPGSSLLFRLLHENPNGPPRFSGCLEESGSHMPMLKYLIYSLNCV